MPNPDNIEFSIVIPLYNEAGCAKEGIREILDALLAKFANRFELILVINGSTDGTGKICERFVRECPWVKMVHLPSNAGYGGGILAGLERAKGTYCGFTCGDRQATPATLVELMKTIRQDRGPHLVKAERVNREDGLLRKIQSKTYNWLFRSLFQLPFQDINAMPKLMQRDVYQQLNLESKDWFIDAEIMIKTHRMGLKIGEIQTEYLKRTSGASTVRLSTVYEFLRNTFILLSSGKLAAWKRLQYLPQPPQSPTTQPPATPHVSNKPPAAHNSTR